MVSLKEIKSMFLVFLLRISHSNQFNLSFSSFLPSLFQLFHTFQKCVPLEYHTSLTFHRRFSLNYCLWNQVFIVKILCPYKWLDNCSDDKLSFEIFLMFYQTIGGIWNKRSNRLNQIIINVFVTLSRIYVWNILFFPSIVCLQLDYENIFSATIKMKMNITPQYMLIAELNIDLVWECFVSNLVESLSHSTIVTIFRFKILKCEKAKNLLGCHNMESRFFYLHFTSWYTHVTLMSYDL